MRSLIEDSKKIVDMIQTRMNTSETAFLNGWKHYRILVPEDSKFPNFIKEMETNK